MPVIINGSTGISGTDGSAATPALQGTDTNTGMFFPAADQIAFAEGGVEAMRLTAAGDVGIGTSSPATKLNVVGNISTTENFFSGSGSGIWFNGANTFSIGIASQATDMAFYANSAERARITATGDFQFNSGYGSVARAFGCRAWVNFNGTGTVAIRASGNVSSVTDAGLGAFVVNYATAMPDANYSAVASLSHFGGVTRLTIVNVDSPSASAILLLTVYGDPWAHYDPNEVYLAIFR